MGLSTKEKGSKLDILDPTGENIGLNERSSYTNEGKTVSLSGRPHIDIAHQGRLIVNGLPIKMTLHRHKDAFALLATGASPSYKIKLLDVVFCVRKVELTTHKFQEIQQSLEKIPVSYPINRAIAADLTSLNWDNAFLGQMPNKILLDWFIMPLLQDPINEIRLSITTPNTGRSIC